MLVFIPALTPSTHFLHRRASVCTVPTAPSFHRGCKACAKLQPERKPRGYWTNVENLRKEILDFARGCGDVATGSMPTAQQLRAAGRRDLDNAISNNGGYKKVAEMLQLSSTSPRRAKGYWDNFDNLKSELVKFAQEKVATIPDGVMPTHQQLRESKRVDIIEAIKKHGGSANVANKLSLKQTKSQKPKHYWMDWSKLESEIRSFVEARDRSLSKAQLQRSPKRMPSQKELRAAGRADLAEAISSFHGGFRAVAKKLGFISRKKDDFFYNSFYNVAQEVYALAAETDEEAVMPSTAVLKERGRTDLAAAIVRFGGMSKVSQRLGLQYQVRTREAFKDWHFFRRSLLSFMERHGKREELPSSRTLANFGRSDLYQAILHHGGSKEVADRMKLKRNYWQDFHNVAKQVLEFVSTHGSDGVMPTEMDFLEVGRTSLNVAVSKFGYSQVAERLGLAEPAQSSQIAFKALLDRSVSISDNCGDCEDFYLQ